jgi:signal transduction histidine kinase
MNYSVTSSSRDSDNLVEKFIYGCSHDLRSPVTSIQGLLRIADYYPHNGEMHKCLEMIEDCTTKMDTLLRNLQEYMTHSHLPSVLHEINATELLEKIHDYYKNRLDACDITLSYKVRTQESWLIDETIISKIMHHLISNSIAYHDPQKHNRKIVINIESDNRGSRLEVSDNGVGIREEQQEKIFDVFYRGSEHSIGSGMGLFLVKGLAEKAGGSVSCRSSFGDGTNIRIYFPG